ncbi:kinesin-domain-containing protein [Metschnikowia bicuspidata var. bicuspidata NRRL YB-4993]|uniref:Kinesin-domain-containing protein n=1 Tax=Metschnikowia bicuspidata var. bicuspidata NRRL YB-4993 TaxID=869754 RepID=A0A1A0HGP5_9ASCO|nr:kinesin-domain-containing protein [Metschnikowia bicuspidata var. bicuspidata NRRL YB-4993]OBA23344.1 kinesin-domain-containing protein [Metschnikowia bicuspidata var. bicuspidata NRRL YB-4993]
MRSVSGPQSPKTPQTKRNVLLGGAGPPPAQRASPSIRPKTSPTVKGALRRNLDASFSNSSNILVFCRLRPFSSAEEVGQASVSVHNIDDKTVTVDEKESSTTFKYDHVFLSDANQETVYNVVGKKTLEDLFQGFNGTILAYGQTGAGKSHTMFGEMKGARTGLGLIPRIAENIFKHIAAGSSDVQYTVGVSLMEIYKEHIVDLLHPQSKAREYLIQQDPANGVHVKGLSHAFVATPEEMDLIFWQGYQLRKKGATALNAESSRSHAIFQVTLTQNNTVDGELKKSNLFLVDLAGSEKFDRSGSQGNTLEEAKKINQSLSTLGLVINSLTDPKCAYVPYRDSKLTRILQESLGGNSRTTLIVNVSPASTSTSESMSTLRFGTRAKNIRNSVHVNSELSMEQLKIRVSLLERLNQELELELKEVKKQPNPSHDLTSIDNTPGAFNAKEITHTVSGLVPSSEELKRKDAKIMQLEQELLELKMNNLKIEHSEDLKLFKLESALHQINDKLKDVELMNENLRRHLIISEKIIKHRDEKIKKLCSVVNDQQMQVNQESAHFESKLRVLKSKLDAQRFRETSRRAGNLAYDSLPSTTETSTEDDIIVQYADWKPITPVKDLLREPVTTSNLSPASPKVGLNLRIVKPLRGGRPARFEDTENQGLEDE